MTPSPSESPPNLQAAELTATLSRLGTDSEAVVRSVDAAVGLTAGHLLLAVGSVVEGLGTSKSDVDLLLIVTDEAESALPEGEIAWTLGRCIVDVRIVRAETVAKLLCRLRDWAQLPWDVSKAAGFSHEDRVLLHRLLRGCRLFPRGEAPRFDYRPAEADLARLKLQVARHLARTIQVDMVGYRDNGDYPSLVFAAQELLGHAVDGLLAGHRVTNPAPKWRSRLLESLPARWSDPIATRWTGLPAHRVYWQLHRAPAEPEPGPALEHATRCTCFARAVCAWAEARLVTGTASEPVRLAWSGDGSRPQEARPYEASPHEARPHDARPYEASPPGLELDVDFRIGDAKVTLARLNEFGGSLTVTAQEFAVLLLLDGQTSVPGAEVAGAGPAAGGVPDIGRLAALARDAGLCLR